MFKLNAAGSDIFVPDNSDIETALKRTTHLGVGAHPDDLEFMAFKPILECYGQKDKWFTGVTTSDGAGSARIGAYAKHTDEMMVATRRLEQRKAAEIGAYSAQLMLNHPTPFVKDPKDELVIGDYVRILEATQPQFVYTHNLADKHDAHVGVALKLVAAIRRLPKAARPKSLTGCEVWRDLDWLSDKDKVVMNVDGNDKLALDLMTVFDSQISGGKRYDLATVGRRKAHATYFESHAADKNENLIFGMDLTPLILDDSLEPRALYLSYMKNFEEEFSSRLNKLTGK